MTTWQFTKLTAVTSYDHILLLYAARMFGMSLIAMTVQTAGLNQLPRHLYAHRTAASNTARMVSSSLGTTYMVTVMTTRTQVHVAEYVNRMTIGNPWMHDAVRRLGGDLAAHLGLPSQSGTTLAVRLLYGLVQKQSIVEGINDAFWIATALAGVALILSLFIRRMGVWRQVEPLKALPEPTPRLQSVDRP